MDTRGLLSVVGPVRITMPGTRGPRFLVPGAPHLPIRYVTRAAAASPFRESAQGKASMHLKELDYFSGFPVAEISASHHWLRSGRSLRTLGRGIRIPEEATQMKKGKQFPSPAKPLGKRQIRLLRTRRSN